MLLAGAACSKRRQARCRSRRYRTMTESVVAQSGDTDRILTFTARAARNEDEIIAYTGT